jgi:predicted ATP-grasp superfamily ATP-dependent carboligase
MSFKISGRVKTRALQWLLPPALLADATWYGTLAAARELGKRGIPVTLACDDWLAPARWSRHVASAVKCPPTRQAERILDWLRAFGAENPGHVLYATSDTLAWIIAEERESLAPLFRIYSPSPQVFATLLDKGQLSQAAEAVGLGTPRTWLPKDESEVERIASEAPFPVFLKPRTQLFATTGYKGGRVDRREDLLPLWKSVRMPDETRRRLAAYMPDAEWPMVTTCYPSSESIFTVDGFIDQSGRMVALGCNKLLQNPRRLGAGVVFEEAPIPDEIEQGLRRMLARAGYFGVFDAEFVNDDGRLRLIDMNPRFYNHMAFEIDRGLPLAWLAYLGAAGAEGELDAAMDEVSRSLRRDIRAYVHRLPTTLLLTAQRVAGSMSREERGHWRRWMAERSSETVDPASEPGDRIPGVVDAFFHAASFLRHPRAFVRSLSR